MVGGVLVKMGRLWKKAWQPVKAEISSTRDKSDRIQAESSPSPVFPDFMFLVNMHCSPGPYHCPLLKPSG